MPDRFFSARPFDETTIRGFLGGRTVVAASLFPSGRINSNYQVDLSDGTTVVVRYYERGSPATERLAMGFVKDAIPVPEILDSGDNWAVMRYLAGRPLAEEPALARLAGRAIAAMARVMFARPGELLPDGGVKPWPFRGLAGFVGDCLARPGAAATLGEARMAALTATLDRYTEVATAMDSESSLVHGDFNPTNILVDKGQLSGVLDWEFAHAGTHWMDVGNLLRDLPAGHHASVAAGLADGGIEIPADWQLRSALVDLSSHLEFLTSDYGVSMKPVALQRIDAFLATYGAEA